MYNKRTFLNKETSSSTGNVVAFDAEEEYDGKSYRNTFLSISDCHNSSRLHKKENESIEDFIDKMKLLKNDIELFINYLEGGCKIQEIFETNRLEEKDTVFHPRLGIGKVESVEKCYPWRFKILFNIDSGNADTWMYSNEIFKANDINEKTNELIVKYRL